jgi:hypothetical protein
MGVVMSVLARAMLVAVRMAMAVAMVVRVWLHFRHVALQYHIGQRWATAAARLARPPSPPVS